MVLPDMAEVRRALVGLALPQYADAFEANGFDTLPLLLHGLRQDELVRELTEAVGMKRGHVTPAASEPSSSCRS